jgi:tetratricopeptide (TPR) repeat protein
MTISRPTLRSLALACCVFLATLALLTFVNHGDNVPPPTDARPAHAPPASAAGRVMELQSVIATGKARPRAYTQLGDAFFQRNRETADAGYLTRAEQAYRGALARDRRDAQAVVGLGTLAAARHDFRAALRYGLAARGLEPDSIAPYPAIVDAYVELGRYADARRALQRFVDLKPGLASYARVSYFRELHGDLRGAAQALELAVSAGGNTPENTAYVQVLLGNLEFTRGRLGAAAHAYDAALASLPGYAPADAGLARVQAARGNLDAAIERLRGVVERRPLPEYAIALAETEIAADRRNEARVDLDVVRAEQRLLAANGVNTDVELAIFDADHGVAEHGVAVARRAWHAAPSVRSADALGWTLTRAGRPAEGLGYARRALRTGSRDPLFLYHAGIAARDANRTREARTLLSKALALNPRFSPLHAPAARKALEGLP